MHRTRLLLSTLVQGLLLSSWFTPARADTAPEKLTVATWNLEWFFDDFTGNNRSDVAKEQSAPSKEEWQWKLNVTAAAIAKFEPTILAVQEVEDRSVIQALTKAIKENHNLQYRVAYIDGYDSGTEQDVAIIYRSGLVEYSRREQTQEMFDSKDYYNLSKHLFARFEWQANGKTESLVALVLHLRATADAADLRRKQAKLAHAWMKVGIEAGENRMIIGDLNVEELAGETKADGDGMFDLLGRATLKTDDDLFDLLETIPADKRRTHLILDKQFDRILVSKPMLAETLGPGIKFRSIEVLSQVNVRGAEADMDHWDTRYTKDRDQRDISDHHPVMATFEFRK
jgi:endonuclease/exonuclease/phosphatase family metal-dependent hydrolase